MPIRFLTIQYALPIKGFFMKQCRKCNQIKLSEEFSKAKRQKDGLQSYCRSCQKVTAKARYYQKPKHFQAVAKKWAKDNPESRKRHRRKALAKRMGTTPEFLEEVKKKTKGRCMICKKAAPLHIDHCHRTSKFRGLLCGVCNLGLGHFQDSPEILKSAISYLRKHLKKADLEITFVEL